MILNIRGTGGSGKTTIVRGLMERASGVEPLFWARGNRPDGYELTGVTRMPLYVLGSYENECGGCDAIKTQDEVCDGVRRLSRLGHVVFEGLIISHNRKRYTDLSQELGGIAFLFLDTPLEICVDRIQKRRLAAGNTAPFNPEQTKNKWHDNRRCARKIQEGGFDVRWIEYAQALDQVLAILKGHDEKVQTEEASRAAHFLKRPGRSPAQPTRREIPDQFKPSDSQLPLI